MLRMLTCFFLLVVCIFGVIICEDVELVTNDESLELESDETLELEADEIPRPLVDETSNKISNKSESVDELFPHRIVNGKRISITEAPYQVALFIDDFFSCGGSILNQRWILTAAHCIDGQTTKSVTIRAGSDFFFKGGQLRPAGHLIVHARYNPIFSNNDIGMVKLRQPLTYNQGVRPIRIPQSSNRRLPATYTVAGWGVFRENSDAATKFLLRTKLHAVSTSRCARIYKSKHERVTDKMICAYSSGTDTCQGDSGGALVSGNVQYGIVSYGLGCARRGIPGVYTDLRQFTRWIRQVAQNY